MKPLLCIVCLFPFGIGCWLGDLAERIVLTGSGNVVGRTFDFSDFDRVHVGHAFQAELRQGDRFAIEVQADDNVMPLVEVTQQGPLLKVGLQSDVYSLRNVTLKALITLPAIRELAASGASHLRADTVFSLEPLALEASGASKITADIDCPRATIAVHGASRIELRGRAEEVEVEASGASDADLRDLEVLNAAAKASGASKARLYVRGRLDADASGASTIRYRGSPDVGRFEESGASSIQGP